MIAVTAVSFARFDLRKNPKRSYRTPRLERRASNAAPRTPRLERRPYRTPRLDHRTKRELA